MGKVTTNLSFILEINSLQNNFISKIKLFCKVYIGRKLITLYF